MAKTSLINSTGLILPLSFFVLLAVNYLVLSLANILFPEQIVLGTASLTRTWSLLLSASTLTILNTFMIPVVHYHEQIRGSMYSNKEWLLSYFLINFVGLWLIARLADNLGLGLSTWWVALLLATALDWLQALGMLALAKLTA